MRLSDWHLSTARVCVVFCLLHAFSSEPSEQSGLSSHIHVRGTQSPGLDLHVNSSGLHTFCSVRGRTPMETQCQCYRGLNLNLLQLFSSEPLGQSVWPSHTHALLTHTPGSQVHCQDVQGRLSVTQPISASPASTAPHQHPGRGSARET